MKKLSAVNYDDAIKILRSSPAYDKFFLTGRWTLTDESSEIKEPCKKLSCPRKAYQFWFFNDCIDVDLIPDNDDATTFDDVNFDAKYICYIEAVKLDYYVPNLSELVTFVPNIGLISAKEIADDVQQTFDNVSNEYRAILQQRIVNLVCEIKLSGDYTKKQMDAVNTWQQETFKEATALSKIANLKQEIEELEYAINGKHPYDEIEKEFADCFLLLYGAAYANRMTYADIYNAVANKMEINRARKWGKPDAQGVVNHIKE